jgi:anti-anti-sigma factor
MTAVSAVDASIDGCACVIALTGEIDYAVAQDVADTAERAIEQASAVHRVLIDLSRVTFLDAGGVGALIMIRQAACAKGLTTRLSGMSHRFVRLLMLLELDMAFGTVLDTGRCQR